MGPILCIGLIFYIAYHAVQGDRGLIAYWQLTKQVERAVTVNEELKERRSKIQNQVSLLSPQTLDRDMLDERVRFLLGYSKPNEFIFYFK
jgi:cell division protein FtsB